MLKVIYFLIFIIVITGFLGYFLNNKDQVNPEEKVVCSMDVLMCPDGSYVGRTGLNCEFVCPDLPEVADDIKAQIEAKSDLIKVTQPVPNAVINSPLEINGLARGNWYFEASFPVVLTDWDGLVIAKGVATAQGDWMTEDFVPFTISMDFVSPYKAGDPDFMKNGSLILQKDNPSGLSENEDALEIPIKFAP